MKPTIELKPFQNQDQPLVKNLILDGLVDHWGVLDESKNPDLDEIATSYANGIFLVAWLDDEIIGTGAFKPHSATQVEIVRMSVKKDLRRQGIGRQILDELLRRAAQAGYEEVILETTETWQDVIDFYLSYGFTITHYLDGDVYFRKELTGEK
jgi:putative acetyltransferase